MKNILLFISLLFTVSVGAQKSGNALLNGSGELEYPVHESVDKTWWNGNRTATGNVSHNAAGYTSAVTRLGGWSLRSGVVANGSMVMDSTAISFIAPSITLSKGSGVNPKLYLDGSLDRIVFTSTGGIYILDNLPTYANDAAAALGLLPQNAIYKTSTGELRIKL